MRLPGKSPAMPYGLDARRALMLAGLATIATLALAYVGTHTDFRYLWQGRNTIAELRELPLGRVKVRGVVTYVDNGNKRFWLQDESGAIAIDQDPKLADARLADGVLVEVMYKGAGSAPGTL